MDPPVIPSIVCGDFNAILVMANKVTSVPDLKDIRNANAFI